MKYEAPELTNDSLHCPEPTKVPGYEGTTSFQYTPEPPRGPRTPTKSQWEEERMVAPTETLLPFRPVPNRTARRDRESRKGLRRQSPVDGSEVRVTTWAIASTEHPQSIVFGKIPFVSAERGSRRSGKSVPVAFWDLISGSSWTFIHFLRSRVKPKYK